MIKFSPHIGVKNYRRMYFDNNMVGVAFEKVIFLSMSGESSWHYIMTFFIKNEPHDSSGTNWSHGNWRFNARKDFLRRKGEMEKKGISLLEAEKLMMLQRIFGDE